MDLYSRGRPESAKGYGEEYPAGSVENHEKIPGAAGPKACLNMAETSPVSNNAKSYFDG